MQVWIWDAVGKGHIVIVCANTIEDARKHALTIIDEDMTLSSALRRQLRREIKQQYANYSEAHGIVLEKDG